MASCVMVFYIMTPIPKGFHPAALLFPTRLYVKHRLFDLIEQTMYYNYQNEYGGTDYP